MKPRITLQQKEKLEIEFWKNNPIESSENLAKENLLNKIIECKHFDYKLKKYNHLIHDKKNILEIGSGQGWASCYFKKYFSSDAHHTVTDISPYALESLVHWEKIFDINIDHSYPAKSYKIDAPDDHFDLIFSFASVHHFVKQEESIIELKRILKSDGLILFLYEPTSPKLWYPLVYKLVNNRHYSTPEDVLIPNEIKKICQNHSLKCHIDFDPYQSTIRSLWSGLYFKILHFFPGINRFVPNSATFIISNL